MNKIEKVIIIGAGLTGLTLAYLLKKKNIPFIIIESRDRLGGRILTTSSSTFAPIELGATWLGKKHTFLNKLLVELDINIFEQRLGNHAIFESISTSPSQLVSLPPNEEPSYRVAGGTSQLIEVLASHLDKDQVLVNHNVKTIKLHEGRLIVGTENGNLEAEKVVSTLPPKLLIDNINITPVIPDNVISTANTTHTWMGESIKIGLCYSQPFWREKKLSGTIFSNVGPISEMYDHSNYEDSLFAVKGFLNSGLYGASSEERKALVLSQLSKYFGDKATHYIQYEEYVWRNDINTYSEYHDYVMPHQHNGNPMFMDSYVDGKLFLAGSETSAEYGGYMEGAVRSAFSVFNKLQNI